MKKLIKCACLVKQLENKLLLVRVRNNKHWYLPGGKIEEFELAEDALKRELSEELNIDLLDKTIKYLCTVTDQAYGEDALVELVCFTADWKGSIYPSAEISEAEWIDITNEHLLAPAVIKLVKQHL
ncbi:NUDIX hydrolase [Priestia megaterium]|uniref:NUDIX hydrolase n=1 Tax=Priestia megaterium TaxID=1404 RepID=UPI000BFD5634|nr:NUDIX domain-containing protein [Priestia megaterium]PGN62177.1 hydrolase [Priestia megaterium]